MSIQSNLKERPARTTANNLLEQLAKDLTKQFGRGFGNMQSLENARILPCLARGADSFDTVERICQVPFTSTNISPLSSSISTLSASFPLPWSAYVRLLSVKRPEARSFYETEALRSGGLSANWIARSAANSTNASRSHRTKPPCWRRPRPPEPGDTMTPEEAIKDPFVLEFLDLKDEYSESDLEEALIHHLTDFLLELGDDFAFLGRQRRLRIDDTWFRIDLVFFHRRLRGLVIVDLKVGKFSYADAGQMHLYLNYAREHWMKPGENPPVGLILCAEKGAAEAHYALDNLPNKVLAAEYQTVLPDEKLIAEELERSRRELEQRARFAHVPSNP